MPLIEKHYPNLAAWVLDGWLEVGHSGETGSFIRLLDERGIVWEGKSTYPSLDAALLEAETAVETWLAENK